MWVWDHLAELRRTTGAGTSRADTDTVCAGAAKGHPFTALHVSAPSGQTADSDAMAVFGTRGRWLKVEEPGTGCGTGWVLVVHRAVGAPHGAPSTNVELLVESNWT